jgi:hypothetical protein
MTTPSEARAAAEEVRQAIELLAAGTSRWGSDECACDDCVRLRRKAKVDVIAKLSGAFARLRT